jgi:major membrane immunogen (membrane-anchored lipoprotein)
MILPGALALVLILTALSLAGCAASEKSQMVDGYYTAEMSAFSHGWKEYVTICVNGGSIKSVEFNAVNPSGFIKAWDMAYMRDMSAAQGMYPNRYTREYAKQLMKMQSADGIDTVSGATVSGGNFRLLADAVVQQAMRGDDEIAVVEVPADEAQPSATPAPTPTQTPTPSPAPTPVLTAQPTATPTPLPVLTPAPTLAPTPTVTPVQTLKPTAMPIATVRPTAMPALSPTPTLKPTIAPIVTARPTVMPALTPTTTLKPTITPIATAQPTSTTDAVSSATISKSNA